MKTKKIINNTCVEVLQGLLNKTKTQTIRKAWKECFKCKGKKTIQRYYNSKPTIKDECHICNGKGVEEKQAKYKVGDIVQQVWNRDSNYDYDWFCKICGKRSDVNHHINDNTCSPIAHGYNSFHRELGEVEITEVFKIKMSKYTIISYEFGSNVKLLLDNFSREELAKRETFKSVEEMFTYFHKNYDLSEPREFWVYRWKWL